MLRPGKRWRAGGTYPNIHLDGTIYVLQYERTSALDGAVGSARPHTAAVLSETIRPEKN